MSDQVKKILTKRQETHGDFTQHATLAQAMKRNCMEHVSLRSDVPYFSLNPVHREALDMIIHKIARIINGDPNEKDHWLDIAGYAQLGARGCKEQEGPKAPGLGLQQPPPHISGGNSY